MRRNAIKIMKTWLDSSETVTALLTGIRGVGKTYIALEFAKSFFSDYIYVNFETDANLRLYIKSISNSINNDDNLISIICSYLNIPFNIYSNILFIIDEIGCSDEAVSLLNIYTSNKPSNIKLLITSSKYNKFLYENKNVTRIDLKPLTFDEFLLASGHEWYKEVIQAHYMTMRRIPDIVHRELLSYFDDYIQIGGMPETVNEFFNFDSDVNIVDKQLFIYNNSLSEIYNNYCEGEAIKQKQILEIIDSQHLKENKKFQYILIRKGATYNLYKTSLDELINSGKVIKADKLICPSIQNFTQQDETSFRLFYSDIGILNMKLKCCEKNINASSIAIKKARLDTYVAEELTAVSREFAFWESNSQAKLDFIIRNNDGIIPIDVRTDETKRTKSLTVFLQQYSTPYSIKLSDKNFEMVNDVKNIPYYSTFCI